MITALKMGEFYGKQITSLIGKRMGYAGLIDQELMANHRKQADEAFVKNFKDVAPQIRDLIVEQIRYQEWTLPPKYLKPDD